MSIDPINKSIRIRPEDNGCGYSNVQVETVLLSRTALFRRPHAELYDGNKSQFDELYQAFVDFYWCVMRRCLATVTLGHFLFPFGGNEIGKGIVGARECELRR